jgi:uncharacterized protein (TIGR03083 family)
MDHLALLADEVVAMTAAVRATSPTAAVASCPGWTAADLCAHLTAVHRWVLGALRNEGPPPYDERPASSDDYADAAAAMVARLRELPPDAPCWTFSRDDATAGFWRRRQLQEVSVHRWDLEQHAIRPDVAAEGVTEVVDFFLPRLVGQGRTVVPAGRLDLDDGTRTWVLVDGPGPQATVTADTATLNLLLWGRRTLDDASVTGDDPFARAVLAATLTP